VTVLMVDDNPANIKLLADLLTSRGYNVEQATNGADALALAQDQPPDIILLDIFMPGMDGYTVCRKLKADERMQDIPVIFISALTDVDDIVRGFDVGGSDYITKPFRFKEVLARIANMLTLVYQRRQIEALREQDRQHFESLNRMQNEFLRMATHDLRNPLNVILGYLRVLDRIEVSQRAKPLLDEARENIQLSVEKMRMLVTDILDLAQIETGQGLHLKLTSLNSVLEKSLQGLRLVAQEKDITLNYDPPGEDIALMLDENRMSRVIDNLVSNAIKYTPAGGQVTLTAQKQDSTVQIDVTDTGLGIPGSDLPHVFEAFYRIEHGAHQREEGSGLGLSIVKSIVEQHDGTINVTSTVGQGSTFRIWLPVVDTAAVTPAEPGVRAANPSSGDGDD
jgi:two-component system sensor histidine kinase/response regulator